MGNERFLLISHLGRQDAEHGHHLVLQHLQSTLAALALSVHGVAALKRCSHHLERRLRFKHEQLALPGVVAVYRRCGGSGRWQASAWRG
jgi:hypothetical protein